MPSLNCSVIAISTCEYFRAGPRMRTRSTRPSAGPTAQRLTKAGHFLGALNEKGKYGPEYGHPEKSQEMLMHVHHIGKKIPYSAITKFTPKQN